MRGMASGSVASLLVILSLVARAQNPCKSRVETILDAFRRAPLAMEGEGAVRKYLGHLEELESCPAGWQAEVYWGVGIVLWKYTPPSGRPLVVRLGGKELSNPLQFVEEAIHILRTKGGKTERLEALGMLIAVEKGDRQLIEKALSRHGERVRKTWIGRLARFLAMKRLGREEKRDYLEVACIVDRAVEGYKRFREPKLIREFWKCPEDQRFWEDFSYAGLIDGGLRHLPKDSHWPPTPSYGPSRALMEGLYQATMEVLGEEFYLGEVVKLLQRGWKVERLLRITRKRIPRRTRREWLRRHGGIPLKVKRLLW